MPGLNSATSTSIGPIANNSPVLKTQPSESLITATKESPVDPDNEYWQHIQQNPELTKKLAPFYVALPGRIMLQNLLNNGAHITEPSLQSTSSTVKKVTVYFPRNRNCYPKDYVPPKFVPQVIFSVNGGPGPYLKHLLDPALLTLDDADDIIIEHKMGQKIYFHLDWPAVSFPQVVISSPSSISRGMLAKISALMFIRFFKQPEVSATSRIQLSPYSGKNIDFNNLRVFCVEKHGETCIPVLGLDIPMD